MLIGLDPLLGPDLLHMLRAMGHGDEIVLVDANFPGTSCGQEIVRLDGIGLGPALRAVLSVLPLDTFVDQPAHVMQVVGDAAAVPPAVAEMTEILADAGQKPGALGAIERFAFYDRARAAYGIVQTGDLRPYANVILTKGVIFG